jgi:hypothetical protein
VSLLKALTTFAVRFKGSKGSGFISFFFFGASNDAVSSSDCLIIIIIIIILHHQALDPIARTIQGVLGEKVNILGGHSIGHSKQRSVYVHVSYSERFPR